MRNGRSEIQANINRILPPVIPRHELIFNQQVYSDDVPQNDHSQENAHNYFGPHLRHTQLLSFQHKIVHPQHADADQPSRHHRQEKRDQEIGLNMGPVPRMSYPQPQTLTQRVSLSLHGVVLILAKLAVAPTRLIQPSLKTREVYVRHRAFAVAWTYQDLVHGVGLAYSTDHGGNRGDIQRDGFGFWFGGIARGADEKRFDDGILLDRRRETACGGGYLWWQNFP